ncbi:hypothetical protein [Geotalea sp. SG265]|uniref:hypothetical protein n=1 Tax=Geotalea sp. SG265 TaxID=2922867 RepID=UPI001FAE860E|nr:hypothetical protein [Geotalea sp. SG265]
MKDLHAVETQSIQSHADQITHLRQQLAELENSQLTASPLPDIATLDDGELISSGSTAEVQTPEQPIAEIHLPANYDPAKAQKITETVSAMLLNPRFWAKPMRPDDFLGGCSIPVFDDRSLQKFYDHAYDYLVNDAAKESQRTNQPVVMPTEDQIKDEVWRRYTNKKVAEVKKALVTQRNTEAAKTGTDPVAVTEEEINQRVDEIVAALRKAEGC